MDSEKQSRAKMLLELEENATGAPWTIGEDEDNPEMVTAQRNADGSFNYVTGGYGDREADDNILVVASRNSIKALAEAYLAMRAELDHIRDECEVKRSGNYGYHSPQDDIEIAKWRELGATTDSAISKFEEPPNAH